MDNREINIRKYDAVLHADGSYRNKRGSIHFFDEDGRFHNEHGPSIIHPSGMRRAMPLARWYLHGKPLSFDQWIVRSPISDEEKMMLRLQYA
jgi:hypothetical protein